MLQSNHNSEALWDEGFIAIAYPEVQENLKLTVDEQMILEEPVSSTGTLSSLQHLTKDFSYGDQFIDDKPLEAYNEKMTADTEAESMVSVTIQQDTSVIPPMTSPVIGPVPRPDSPNVQFGQYQSTQKPHPLQQTNSSTHSTKHKGRQIPSSSRRKLRQKSKQDSPKTPPGSPPSPPPLLLYRQAGSGASGTSRAPILLTAPPSNILVIHLFQLIQEMNNAYSSGEEVGRDHIPSVNLRQSWWKPLTEDRPATPKHAWTIPSSDLPVPTNNWASALKTTYVPPPENSLLAQTGDIATFMDWYCKRQRISELTPKDLEGPAYEIVKVFYPDVVHLQFQMEECHKLLTDKVDDAILKYDVSKPLPTLVVNQIGRPALSISKMKAAFYPDVGLEQLVPDQFWIEEECKYDIAAMYGISHWWFQRQRFYIDKFSSEGDRRACGALLLIDDALNYRVKEFIAIRIIHRGVQVFGRRKDVVRRKEFMFRYPEMANEHCQFFWNLELCWWTDSRRRLPEIRLKMNLPDHRIKLWWKWRYLVPVESIHSPMLTLNVFNQRHHDNRKTYNTASATLISNVMIKKSMSMQLKKEKARDKELFEEAKEENRKQYEEKLKFHALTMKEEMVKEANAKIAEMFAQYTLQLPIPPS
ncbi:hypothetical protein Tco_0644317 [Tanacetum coccineum]